MFFGGGMGGMPQGFEGFPGGGFPGGMPQGFPGGMGGMGGMQQGPPADTTALYKVLGVEKSASASDIKKAFRKKAQTFMVEDDRIEIVGHHDDDDDHHHHDNEATNLGL